MVKLGGGNELNPSPVLGETTEVIDPVRDIEEKLPITDPNMTAGGGVYLKGNQNVAASSNKITIGPGKQEPYDPKFHRSIKGGSRKKPLKKNRKTRRKGGSGKNSKTRKELPKPSTQTFLSLLKQQPKSSLSKQPKSSLSKSPTTSSLSSLKRSPTVTSLSTMDKPKESGFSMKGSVFKSVMKGWKKAKAKEEAKKAEERTKEAEKFYNEKGGKRKTRRRKNAGSGTKKSSKEVRFGTGNEESIARSYAKLANTLQKRNPKLAEKFRNMANDSMERGTVIRPRIRQVLSFDKDEPSSSVSKVNDNRKTVTGYGILSNRNPPHPQGVKNRTPKGGNKSLKNIEKVKRM